MRPISQLHDPFAYGRRRGIFSAWTMAIVFATVAMVSFAIDQTLGLAPDVDDQNAPSLLHPVQLIQSLMEAAAELRLLVTAGLCGALGFGCSGPKPILLEGNANSAQVGYYGEIEGATIVARQHCARYERVPRFLEAQEDVAYFDCVRP